VVDNKKINDVRKKIKKTVDAQKMIISNEPEFSGSPKNTIMKDAEEREDEKGRAKQEGSEGKN